MKYVVSALFLVLMAPAMAETPGVEEIVAKANQAAYYAGGDGKAKVKMVITDSKGGTRERAFTVLRRNGEGDNQKFYVYFEAPADVRKMAFLVWKNAGGDDDRWLWLPALNLSKRIAPGDKRTSFVGSDFVYEDVSGRGTEEDTHRLVAETDSQYQLESIPKDAGSVDFSRYVLWIDKATWLPVKAEYYDHNNNLFRRVEALAIKEISGIPTVMESRVSDLRTGGNTLNTFSDIEYGIGLKERIFSERFLRRPPKEIR